MLEVRANTISQGWHIISVDHRFLKHGTSSLASEFGGGARICDCMDRCGLFSAGCFRAQKHSREPKACRTCFSSSCWMLVIPDKSDGIDTAAGTAGSTGAMSCAADACSGARVFLAKSRDGLTQGHHHCKACPKCLRFVCHLRTIHCISFAPLGLVSSYRVQALALCCCCIVSKKLRRS